MTADARTRLADARLYLCTDGRRDRGDLPSFLDAVLAGGVDIVQLREKGLEAAAELALLEVFADACRRHGKLLAVNDRADIALAAGADVLHLGQDDLPVAVARRILGPSPVIGRSSHDVAQATLAAASPGVDYFCAGPVWTTPTKPGRPATGLSLISAAASAAAGRPWFAIGGISLGRLDSVLAAGATRVVVVRAITEADDPGAAARSLAKRLRALPGSSSLGSPPEPGVTRTPRLPDISRFTRQMMWPGRVRGQLVSPGQHQLTTHFPGVHQLPGISGIPVTPPADRCHAQDHYKLRNVGIYPAWEHAHLMSNYGHSGRGRNSVTSNAAGRESSSGRQGLSRARRPLRCRRSLPVPGQ
jgi:thiamine-phosphate pyrophosphorylase